MRTDNALNDHLEQQRAACQPKLVYDIVTDEMVTEAVLAERQKKRAAGTRYMGRVGSRPRSAHRQARAGRRGAGPSGQGAGTADDEKVLETLSNA